MLMATKTQEGLKTHQDQEPDDPRSDEDTLYSLWIATGRKSINNTNSIARSSITTPSDTDPGRQKKWQLTNKPHW
jgi:hypothetical protein